MNVKRLSESVLTVIVAVMLAVALVGCQTTAKKAEAIPPAPVIEVAPAPAAPAKAETVAPAAVVEAPAKVEAPAPAAVVEAPAKAETAAPAAVAETAPAKVVEATPAPAKVAETAPAKVEATAPAKTVAAAPKSEYPYGVNTTVKNARGDKEFDLFVVHTNDIDGAFSGEAGGMSLAQLATLAKIGAGVTDNWLLFNTGSIGDLDDTTALQVAKAFDEIGYSAYTPQSIQLASGVTGTSKAVALSANALDANGYLLETPYQVYSFNGFKVAVVGLTAPKDVPGVSFTSDIILANAQAAIDMARKLVDYVIVIADTGDEGQFSSEYICKNLNGIDLFVAAGGDAEAKTVNGAKIVRADSKLRSIGVVQLHVKDGKVTATYPMTVPVDAVTDPADSKLVKQYASYITAYGYSATAPVPEDPAVSALLPYPYGVKMVEKNTAGTKTFDLIVVHTNDVHARIVPADGGMGYAKLATLLKMGRSITDNILVLDAGDVSHGTNLANLFQGEPVGVLLDMLGYDAVAPGNHDFNYGSARLIEEAKLAEKYSNVRVLSANFTTDDGQLVLQPYQLYDFNGFKVGVIGLTTPDTKAMSHPKNTEGYSFNPDTLYERTQKMVNIVKKYADFVIVLGHIGVDETGANGITSIKIAQNVKGIDLFVDGHSHTELPQGKQVGDTLIVQTGEYLKNVGVVDVLVKDGKVDSKTAMLVPAKDVLDPAKSDLAKKYGITSIPDDPEVTAYVKSVNDKLAEQMNQVIATIPTDLDGQREHVRTRQTNLSKLITAAMTESSGADFTITNGGGIRASLKAGNVTKGDVINVLPFTNIITVCEMKGSDVYAALEHGYEKLPVTDGRYAQSDLQVVYNRFAQPGKRILRVLLNGKLIDKNATYKVATNDFMAAGGDGYTMFGKKLSEGSLLSDVFMDYLTKHFPVK
ncbi:MAG: 5'-nucleotidase C-terminal domain-containing protein [Sphaerochaeta sp.]|jgi:2',3'-cyclic-nucleotide 2'-phosphodiesterase (5'-nucleotidase family)|nr:5'-nucleotidase C-terminal domain-containing protein [Sphaerochaeta sp.]